MAPVDRNTEPPPSSNRPIALGVGLGVGSLVILVTAIFLYFLLRMQAKRLTARRTNADPEINPDWSEIGEDGGKQSRGIELGDMRGT
ncbi:hypothetical protein MMC14_003774 [Varicellaria rhodocarpa]|nr:hypothetical protein [Varicellaria rhodocarpa]